MNNTVLLAVLTKMIDEKLETHLPGHRGPRGFVGPKGEDFKFEEVAPLVKDWVKEFSLKFSDLNSDDIEKLRGPCGPRGYDGKSFVFEEHQEEIQDIVKNIFSDNKDYLKLKFEDLNSDDIEKIRGPRGRDGRNGSDGNDGRDGKDFNFEEHKEYFDSLKLKFSDLTAEDIEQIRGPRGRDGRDGRDGETGKSFVFEEHKEYFDSLKLKFSDLSEDEREQLKLKFENLSYEDIQKLRGSRGQKGKKGSQGERGERGIAGPMGPRGVPGMQGLRGITGAQGPQGISGRSGKDAPTVTEIILRQNGTKFSIEFYYSDGSIIETNEITFDDIAPKTRYIYVGGGSGEGGGGGGGTGTVQSVNEVLPNDSGDISLLLADLLDVDLSGAEDGDVLTFDILSGLWVPRASGSGEPIKKQTIPASSTVEVTDLAFNSAQVIDATISMTAAFGNIRQPITMRMYFTDVWEMSFRDDDDTLGLIFTHDDTTGQVSVENPNGDEVKLQWKLETVFREESIVPDSGVQELLGSTTTEIDDLIFDSDIIVDAKMEYTSKKGTGRQPGTIRVYFTDQWYVVHSAEDDIGISFSINTVTGQVSAINNSGDAELQWKLITAFNKEA